MNTHPLRSSAAACAFALTCGLTAVTVSLSGCGSGSGTTAITSSPTASFAGKSFSGSVTLDAGRAANLQVTSNADGTVSGTVDLLDTTRAKTRVVRIGNGPISGTYDPVTGAFHLSANVLGNGIPYPFSMTGTFPTPPAVTGGSYNVTFNGQTFSSVFGSSPFTPTATPTPTPTPTPSGNPTPTPTPTATPTGGVSIPTLSTSTGTAGFVISHASGTNIGTTQYSPLLLVTSSLAGNPYTSAIKALVIAPSFGGSGGNPGTASQTITAIIGTTQGAALPTTGQRIPISPSLSAGSAGDPYATVTYHQQDLGGTYSGYDYDATGGTLVVVSVVGQKVTFRVEGATMIPTPGGSRAGAAQGTFTLDAVMTANTVTGLP